MHVLVQSHIGQEEGRTTMVAAPVIKKIGALRSHITFDKLSRKEFEKNSADKPVHDEGVDAFASHQESTFLV